MNEEHNAVVSDPVNQAIEIFENGCPREHAEDWRCVYCAAAAIIIDSFRASEEQREKAITERDQQEEAYAGCLDAKARIVVELGQARALLAARDARVKELESDSFIIEANNARKNANSQDEKIAALQADLARATEELAEWRRW